MTPPADAPAEPPTDTSVELVVLLDEAGRAVGTADKRTVHHAATPLHLAFSCYLFDDEGRVLLTRRALHKRTFPGVWTNAACGHPAPGEGLEDAVRRRVREELGTGLRDLRLLLPGFRYRAEMDGVVENEMCPVLAARAAGPLHLDPDEVADARWESWDDVRVGILDGSLEVSAWCREQVAELPADPWGMPQADPTGLPAAIRSGASSPSSASTAGSANVNRAPGAPGQ